MNDSILFTPCKVGDLLLKNRVVMAPMTRSRALDNIPSLLAVDYYSQRAGAGLIITEGTSPSPNGLGYARIPGLFSHDQVQAWKKVTGAVHAAGGLIFVQLMHTGRIGHPLNLPPDGEVLAPSPVKAAGKMFTDEAGLQEYPVPKEMTAEEVIQAQDEFAFSAARAMEVGFDGVELHGANGYLIEQFLSPHTNRRTDAYGGNTENRCRFVLETVDKVSAQIGKERLGIRLSPYGVSSDMKPYSGMDEEYTYLAEKLSDFGIAYIHLVDHSSMGAPEVPVSIKRIFRQRFKNILILSGGYNQVRAENDLKAGFADLIAFGKPFISNPDLVERFRNNWPLAGAPDTSTFYTPGAKGYTDYEPYRVEEVKI